MPSTRFYSLLASVALAVSVRAGLPDKIYGTNIGSWLVLEPWMLPQEWVDMGGQQCSDCSTCIASEFAFAQAYPDTVDAKFKTHWTTWFTQSDVDNLVGAGINTVRIPLGYWIVEPLVDRATEFYPKGGMVELQRGLQQLTNAGISVILDHHALPGVASPGQMFAGRCTNDVQFYTSANYHRALVWTAVITALSHVDPNFAAVAALEAINEPIMDANQTPGMGDFQKHFVQTVRAVELSLGVPVPGTTPAGIITSATNVSEALTTASTKTSLFNADVLAALVDAVPMFTYVVEQLGLNIVLETNGLRDAMAARSPLVTTFMDINWQQNSPANPADAAIGPQGYDNHLYYSFGGVADATEDAYLTSVCNLDRIEKDAALNNSPLWFGEWGLSTQFDATDDFLKKW
ncbi:hypothetical protein CVT24_005827, partial [Panaeolus cyanescens]